MRKTFCQILLVAFTVMLCLAPLSARADILTTTPDDWTPVQLGSLIIKVPDDSGIIRSSEDTPLIRDIGTADEWERFYRNELHAGFAVRNEPADGKRFTVHARVSNGTTGSGVKYNVGIAVSEAASGYAVILTPQDRGTYRQGLFGKFSVPNFSDEDLLNHLHDGQLRYKFEVNSTFPGDAVFSNFVRLASPIPNHRNERDALSGKVFSQRFHIPYGGGKLYFTVETYPYRTGSKAVIYAAVPSSETAPGEIDYAVILADVKGRLEKIAND